MDMEFAKMYKYFLMRHITHYNGRWYCYLCKLENLIHAKRHLQKVHPDIHIKISDFSDKFIKLSNTKCIELINHGIVIKNVLQNCNTNYFCVPCKCSIPTLDHVDEHLKGKRHEKYIISTKLELLYHGIMKNILQTDNTEYFCILCNCSIPTLYNVNEHLKGKQHQKYISSTESKNVQNACLNPQNNSNKNMNSNVFVNVKTHTKLINKSKYFAKIKPVCKKTRKNQKGRKNKLTKDNSTNSSKEKKSITFFKSCEKDNNSNDILQIEKCINMSFCNLCDKFNNKLTIKKHEQDEKHISAISALKIFNEQAIYIINLENNRKTIKPLQLNSRKLDGTIWPEYTKTMSKYTCDQCNIIEKNDIINHEITVHKKNMISFMRYIQDLNEKNIFSYYPMFKCSFCNEIIHGISVLEIHFSKCQHEKNIKLLIKTKRQEYNCSKNVESFFELFEFLNLISFENNGDIVKIMEQPVMYIKNHITSFHKRSDDLIQIKFTYICIACKCKFYAIKDAINHLSTKKKHLKHFQNILLTYNHIHSIYTIKEFNINKVQAVQSPVIGNTLINTLKHNINKTQVAQYLNNNNDLIAKANTSKNNILSQNEESNSGLFMSSDIFLEINEFIMLPKKKNISKLLQTKHTQNNNNVDRYNRMYYKKFLDFEEIIFTDNQNKLNEIIKLNLQLYALKYGNMLCLACNVTHSYNIHTLYEHICCEQHVVQLTQLHLHNCKNSKKQKLKLSQELIKVDYTNFQCYACNEKWDHDEFWVKKHMHYFGKNYKKNRKKLFKDIKCTILQEFNLWYNIQYFVCVECNTRFKIKIEFMEHLDKKHNALLNTKDNSKLFDFCITCTTLWYKNQGSSYQQHCQKITHKYLAKSNDFAVMSLPQSLQKLLKNINKTVDHLFKLSNDVLNDEKRATKLVVEDLKNTFKTQEFNYNVDVHMFGSRYTGLALPNSDIDIYLNFNDKCFNCNGIDCIYCTRLICTEFIEDRSEKIRKYLHTDNKNWEIELILIKGRTPLIKVKHRPTGLQCDISFKNGLSVENSKLIKSFITAYPPCRKLILFLKKWISLGNLTGFEGIKSYALTWLVIFYLQVKYKIPSVADLIKNHNHSKIIFGWETGVSSNIPIDVPELSIQELLLGFFEYYGCFDYMHDVICPLLGFTYRKEFFTELSSLPDTMELYIKQLQSAKPEYFRIDSSMCVQDPFDLSHNLTKAVPILTLKRFKQYCNESASILNNNCISSSKKM